MKAERRAAQDAAKTKNRDTEGEEFIPKGSTVITPGPESLLSIRTRKAQARYAGTKPKGARPTDAQKVAAAHLKEAVVALAVVIEENGMRAQDVRVALQYLEDVQNWADRAIFLKEE